MWKNYSKELIVEGDCMKGKVRAGYSLIELMIAMAISAIVLTAIIGLIGFATRNMRITQTSVDLQNQAKETLTGRMAMPFILQRTLRRRRRF